MSNITTNELRWLYKLVPGRLLINTLASRNVQPFRKFVETHFTNEFGPVKFLTKDEIARDYPIRTKQLTKDEIRVIEVRKEMQLRNTYYGIRLGLSPTSPIMYDRMANLERELIVKED